MSEADLTELVREGWSRKRRPLAPRRALTEVFAGGAFVAAAVTLAVTAEATTEWALGPTLALVAMFAVGIRIQIDIGVTYTAPVQLAFVPMLLLLPTPFVPLLVLVAWFIGKLPELFGPNRIHPDRLLLLPGDCWFSLGPALVLVAFDAQTPDWSDWPVYLLALPAQFGLEALASYVRDWIGEGVPPRLVLRELWVVWGIDALLSPLGLLAAFAAEDFDYAFLLLVPPAGLLGVYAAERVRRLRSALALADAARDREGLIAGASHELVTPLGVLVGLTDRLTAGEMAPERRAQLDMVMRREVLAMRQIVRQFVDYTRIKTERDLLLHPEPTPLEPIISAVASALASAGRIEFGGLAAAPPALVDPSRAHQMVLSVVAEGIEGADSVRLELDADYDTVSVIVTSTQPPRERPFAEGGEGFTGGLGLYVTRELARRQGGDATVEPAGEGGARYALTLPRAGES